MRRRDFFELSAALAAGQAPRVRAAGRPLMKLGTQHGESDDILRTMAAFGVNHICAHTPSKQPDENWSVEGLTKLRERAFRIAPDHPFVARIPKELLDRAAQRPVLLTQAQAEANIAIGGFHASPPPGGNER